MRERLDITHPLHLLYRITPACAGKTTAPAKKTFLLRDHPRVCGKDHQKGEDMQGRPGSPPRVRERRYLLCGSLCPLRITPACAGKTSPSCSDCKDCRDHPRVCGKDFMNTRIKNTKIGSPPRVRERRARFMIHSVVLGITPACAGKTYLNSIIL